MVVVDREEEEEEKKEEEYGDVGRAEERIGSQEERWVIENRVAMKGIEVKTFTKREYILKLRRVSLSLSRSPGGYFLLLLSLK